jgi:LmbE family N-acetylglucosaminyl deacetylase
MNKKKKVLIVEAHSDDSAISIGGFLDKFSVQCEYHFALVVCSDIKLHHSGLLTRDERLEEYRQYVEHFHGHWHLETPLPLDADACLDTIPKRKIVAHIETIIGIVKPDVLICQGPSFHHDHTIVYESVIAATRPTARHLPDEIYICENPTYVHSLGVQTDFKPDFYVNLTEEQLNRKLECFRIYFPSQIRDDNNALSEDGIRAWSRYRGIEARCKYAEAMHTYIRVV